MCSQILSTLDSQCSKLRYANLGNTGIGDAVLKSLAHNCPGLQYLVVSGCLEMGIRAFLDTVLQAKLKHLDIRDCNFSEVFVNMLKQEHPLIKIVDLKLLNSLGPYLSLTTSPD